MQRDLIACANVKSKKIVFYKCALDKEDKINLTFRSEIVIETNQQFYFATNVEKEVILFFESSIEKHRIDFTEFTEQQSKKVIAKKSKKLGKKKKTGKKKKQRRVFYFSPLAPYW